MVYALAHATGKTGRFTLIERWRNNERLLAPQEHPLKVRSFRKKAVVVVLLSLMLMQCSSLIHCSVEAVVAVVVVVVVVVVDG